MKKRFILLLAVINLISFSLVTPSPAVSINLKNIVNLYLYEKNPLTWRIVPKGGWGKMQYLSKGPAFNFVFNGHGLDPRTGYTLLYYPDPWPGHGLIVLGNGLTNRGGNIHIAGSVNLNTDLPFPCDGNYPTGAKIWLVKTDDVDPAGKKMARWNPADYLFEEKMIHYTDTDYEINYSGTYCLLLSDGPCSGIEMVINQSDGTITFTVPGLPDFVGTGSVSGNTMTLTGSIPDSGALNMILTFSCDGQTFSGTYSLGGESGTLTGIRDVCADPFPAGEPASILPIPLDRLDLVVGGQQFNSVHDGVVHTGLDFEFNTPLPTIISPIDGVVQRINRHAISAAGLIAFDVEIRYNRDWSTIVVFEPYSSITAIADQQEAEISVRRCQAVRQGDVLGRLVVPEPITEFPHIHWQVYRNDTSTPFCPRNFLTAGDQTALDGLYGRLFGPGGVVLLPVCLP